MAETSNERFLAQIRAGASLENMIFRDLTLQGAQLARAIMRGVRLENCDLSGANLEQANLRGAVLVRCNLSGTFFMKADLTDADLSFSDLTGASFEGAVMLASQLQGASLESAILNGADLTRAKADSTTSLEGATLRNATLGHAEFDGVQASRATFSQATLRTASLRGAKVIGAILDGADLSDAILTDADLQGADLGGAMLKGANLANATATNARLDGADLRGASLQGLVLSRIRSIRRAGIDVETMKRSRWSPEDVAALVAVGAELRGSDPFPILVRRIIESRGHALVVQVTGALRSFDRVMLSALPFCMLGADKRCDLVDWHEVSAQVPGEQVTTMFWFEAQDRHHLEALAGGLESYVWRSWGDGKDHPTRRFVLAHGRALEDVRKRVQVMRLHERAASGALKVVKEWKPGCEEPASASPPEKWLRAHKLQIIAILIAIVTLASAWYFVYLPKIHAPDPASLTGPSGSTPTPSGPKSPASGTP